MFCQCKSRFSLLEAHVGFIYIYIYINNHRHNIHSLYSLFVCVYVCIIFNSPPFPNPWHCLVVCRPVSLARRDRAAICHPDILNSLQIAARASYMVGKKCVLHLAFWERRLKWLLWRSMSACQAERKDLPWSYGVIAIFLPALSYAPAPCSGGSGFKPRLGQRYCVIRWNRLRFHRFIIPRFRLLDK